MTETTLETILLVEDEPAVRQLFAQALKRAGYSIYEARNGQEAMKLFDQHGEIIDMLLTDMRMPYMGGAELAHHLRGRRRSLKRIADVNQGLGHRPETEFLGPMQQRDLVVSVQNAVPVPLEDCAVSDHAVGIEFRGPQGSHAGCAENHLRSQLRCSLARQSDFHPGFDERFNNDVNESRAARTQRRDAVWGWSLLREDPDRGLA